METNLCTIDGCEKPIKYRSMCGMHYKRAWRHNDPNFVAVVNKLPDEICKVENCTDKITHSAGLCKLHEQRFRRYGRLENIIAPKGAGGFDSQGYYLITVDGVRVYEHRYIMEKYLGRKLLATEIVHHRNGERWNNKLDNLELIENQSEHMKLHRSNFVCE